MKPSSQISEISPLELHHRVETPEGVAFGYPVVGIGNRAVAALVDTAILAVLNVLLLILMMLLYLLMEDTVNRALAGMFLEQGGEFVSGLLLAIAVVLFFLFNLGYFLLFETLWNGQTPGKRWAGIRVIRRDGRPVDFLSAAIRNLVRLVDFLPTAYLLGLTVMVLDPYSRRLGDLAAGTLVVKDQGPAGLEQVTSAARRPRETVDVHAQAELLMAFPGIRRLRHRDFALIQESLARFDQGALPGSTLMRLAQAMARRLAAEPPQTLAESRAFLERVVQAYQLLEEDEA